MRIALLNPTYWPEVQRGTERIVRDLGVALAQAGHEVTVFTSHRAPRKVSHEDGVRIVRSRRPRSGPLDRRGFEHHLVNGPAVARSLACRRFDIAHAFGLADAWAAVQAQRFLSGPPVVLSWQGVPNERSLSSRRLRLPMLRAVVRRAGAIVMLSEAAAAPFRSQLGHEPVILPNGIFLGDFEVEAPPAREPTLICAASLKDPRKRGDLLLRAFAALRERRPQARLVLAAGRDPFAAGSAGELGPGVERLDSPSTEALAHAYASASASVLASVDEAFGLVLLESLAAGTPVVAARSGASPEVLAGAPAVLFEPDDEADLVRALDEVLELATRPGVAEACRRHARAWDWSIVTRAYEAVYEDVARSGGPGTTRSRRRQGTGSRSASAVAPP
jgi:phosphatidylinositol alpha-mannosyltransferase